MSVPTFGDWDMKNGAMPDYSMDFTKIREMRKQNKKEISRASLGNEEELPSNPRQGGGAHRGKDGNPHHRPTGSDEMDHRGPLHHVGDHSPTVSKYFSLRCQLAIGRSCRIVKRLGS